MRRLIALGVVAALSGCGDLPQPFKGNPGAAAIRLSQPPPTRLAVPTPADSLLGDESAQAWSQALADGLLAQELPAIAGAPSPGDWRIMLAAKLDGSSVTPTYTVVDPKGLPQGSISGPPVAAGLWANGDAATVKAAAGAEVPMILGLLTSIQAHEQQSDPHSLLNRPPQILFTNVTGAPGDGNTSLARLIKAQLPTHGDIMVDNPRDADFTVRCEVKTAPGANGSTRVEIQWIVADAKGRESGRVAQINEVPAHTLDNYWGEVAEVVAQEAAGGVHEVIVQASGRGDTGPPPAAGAGPPPAAGAGPPTAAPAGQAIPPAARGKPAAPVPAGKAAPPPAPPSPASPAKPNG